MRELKLRYKWKGDWYYIDLRNDNTRAKFEAFESVNKNTPLEEFTGLYATKGKGFKKDERREVYEGDVFREQKETDNGDVISYLVVMWIKQRAAFYLVNIFHYPVLRDNDVSEEKEFDWLFQNADLYDFSFDVGLPLVGNIWDNPELLKSE